MSASDEFPDGVMNLDEAMKWTLALFAVSYGFALFIALYGVKRPAAFLGSAMMVFSAGLFAGLAYAAGPPDDDEPLHRYEKPFAAIAVVGIMASIVAVMTYPVGGPIVLSTEVLSLGGLILGIAALAVAATISNHYDSSSDGSGQAALADNHGDH